MIALSAVAGPCLAEVYCSDLAEWDKLKESRHGSYSRSDATQIVTDNGINVRSGPGTGYERLFQLNAGDHVLVLEKCDATLKAEGAVAHWYKIECWMGRGYICGRWLSSKWREGDLDGDGRKEYLAAQFFNDIPPDYEGDWPEDDGYSWWCGDCLYIDGGAVSVHREVRVGKESPDEILRLEGFEVVENAGFSPPVSLLLVTRSATYGSGSCHEFQLYFFRRASGTFEKITQFSSSREGDDMDYATVYLPAGRLELCSGPLSFVESERGEEGHLLVNRRHYTGGRSKVPPRSGDDENEDLAWDGGGFSEAGR
jgi:hypothetical protein